MGNVFDWTDLNFQNVFERRQSCLPRFELHLSLGKIVEGLQSILKQFLKFGLQQKSVDRSFQLQFLVVKVFDGSSGKLKKFFISSKFTL